MENLTSSIYEELEEIRQKIQANIGLLELFADKVCLNFIFFIVKLKFLK